MGTRAVSEDLEAIGAGSAMEYQPAGGKQYPLANVLGEGPNVSIRLDTPREMAREIVMWALVGVGLGAMAWTVFEIGMRMAK